jgi:hypothetical protein
MSAILGMSIEGISEDDMQLAGSRLVSHVDSLMHAVPQVAGDFGAQYARIYHYAGRHTEAKEFWVAVWRKEEHFLVITIQTLLVLWIVSQEHFAG